MITNCLQGAAAAAWIMSSIKGIVVLQGREKREREYYKGERGERERREIAWVRKYMWRMCCTKNTNRLGAMRTMSQTGDNSTTTL